MTSVTLEHLPERLLTACETGDLHAAAYAWAALGVPVLPLFGVDEAGRCLCGQPHCLHAGKHPHSEHAPRGYKSATTDPGRLNYIYSQASNCNLGLRMAAPGSALPLVALDIDIKRDGFGGLERLQDANGPLPATLRIQSGGGGQHYIFRSPRKVRPPSRMLLPGVEFMADRSLLVAAPSRHETGNRYAILDDHPPVLLPESWLSFASSPRSGGLGKVSGYSHSLVQAARIHVDGALEVASLSPQLRVEVERVISKLLVGPHAEEAAGLLAGDRSANTAPDKSPSGDDFRLCLLAKRHTRDAEVIEAILRSSGLYRSKYERPDYLPGTIQKALQDDRDWLADQQERRSHPVGKRGVFVRDRVMQAIITYLQEHGGDQELVRLPVNDIAREQSVCDDTVTNAIDDLEGKGKITTDLLTMRTSKGGWKRTRVAQLTP